MLAIVLERCLLSLQQQTCSSPPQQSEQTKSAKSTASIVSMCNTNSSSTVA